MNLLPKLTQAGVRALQEDSLERIHKQVLIFVDGRKSATRLLRTLWVENPERVLLDLTTKGWIEWEYFSHSREEEMSREIFLLASQERRLAYIKRVLYTWAREMAERQDEVSSITMVDEPMPRFDGDPLADDPMDLGMPHMDVSAAPAPAKPAVTASTRTAAHSDAD
jgi:hypothetical protein